MIFHLHHLSLRIEGPRLNDVQGFIQNHFLPFSQGRARHRTVHADAHFSARDVDVGAGIIIQTAEERIRRGRGREFGDLRAEGLNLGFGFLEAVGQPFILFFRLLKFHARFVEVAHFGFQGLEFST